MNFKLHVNEEKYNFAKKNNRQNALYDYNNCNNISVFCELEDEKENRYNASITPLFIVLERGTTIRNASGRIKDINNLISKRAINKIVIDDMLDWNSFVRIAHGSLFINGSKYYCYNSKGDFVMNDDKMHITIELIEY